MATRRNARSLSLLASAVGLMMVAVVGAAPEATAATLSGPFAPGTTTADTANGHTVEWQVSDFHGCGVSGTWFVFASGDGLDDVTADPEAGGGGTAASTITATITGDVGSTATLNVSIMYNGLIIDPGTGGMTPCSATNNVGSSFTVTGADPAVVPTTASLKYKPALPGFTGKLTAEQDCDDERKVHLYKKDAGPDTKLDTKTSGGDGSYKFKGKAKNGTYYVKAPKDDRGEVVCGAAKSPNVKVG